MNTEIQNLSSMTGISEEAIKHMAEHVVSLMSRDGVTEQDMIEAGDDLSAAYLIAAVKQNKVMATRATMNQQQFAKSVFNILSA